MHQAQGNGSARREIRVLLNDREVRTDRAGPSDTLLDFLRLERRLTGTKEGCAEGDCGACTVLVGRLADSGLVYEPVNACIRFLVSLDGCHVVTVEHLSGPDGRLHPVQEAMVEHHASQCGFCTPGFVMALYALWMANPDPTEDEIETAIQGNLCRCTGYAPIVRAAHAASRRGTPAADHLARERDGIAARLAAMRDGARVEIARDGDRAILPADVDDLAAVLEANPQATIVAGATDVGLWVTKFLRPIAPAVFTGHLESLREIRETADAVEIGAGASYADCEPMLARAFPHLSAYWRRIGGAQVRAMGTVGGNIANGSPIGDTPPVLIALGATVTLRRGARRRTLPLEDFFIDYGKQDREEGEFVESVTVPRPAPGSLHAAYKISKRRDEDISSVAAGFNLRIDGGRIAEARIAFGGMAATPKRAGHAEAALQGSAWSEASLLAAADALERDFTPLSDWRASADYRMRVAKNLFRRFWFENSAPAAPAAPARATA